MWNEFDVSAYSQRWQAESKRREKRYWRWLMAACVAAVVLGGAVGAFMRL